MKETDRLNAEEGFHDAWASESSTEEIDIKIVNEACTAPEMRCIREALGDLKGRTLLDIGCGLGEASVYFATLGADVTSTDLSGQMLAKTQELARKNHTSVRTHKATAESLNLSRNQTFDVVYAGNLFHHVDIAQTLERVTAHIQPKGMLVSWDPVAYNPLINVYRRVATKVRTEDEHPLTMRDLQLFKDRFQQVTFRWFWLSTLLIFVIMVLVQRRNPNKERYWKAVLYEGEKWRWLYAPLERLDGVLLRLFPFLRRYCWNVVVIAQGPKAVG
ncbi:MAG: class I SAM-dependent methyltransferase [Elusimicrobia bacterium]|nr:class I SAM-dependent methyltransferase [Elusimicrobiota bacterium]